MAKRSGKQKSSKSSKSSKGAKSSKSAGNSSGAMDKVFQGNATLKTTLQQIEKQFGQGSIMPLGAESRAWTSC